MLSKRIRDISRLILDGHDGSSGPTQALVDILHDSIRTGMKWLEELAEIEIQSKQRWFELQRHGAMNIFRDDGIREHPNQPGVMGQEEEGAAGLCHGLNRAKNHVCAD